MKEAFKALKVADDIYWVGAIDWSVRDFHGYHTGRGTTYNAYLVTGEKNILIDTVKAPFKDELLGRIASVLPPEKIDYIISNHSEVDHSGSLPQVIEAIRPEKVFASKMGQKALAAHFHGKWEVTAVGDGEKMKLGSHEFTFYETRMLHWPDSMFSYLADRGILFSQDAFGMHLASSERFADEIDGDVLEYEAAKYYANILLPLSLFVTKLIEKVSSAGLEFKMILPDHGPMWRSDVGKIVGLYGRWAAQEPADKALIIYDTMWQSTALMARAIGEGVAAGGSDVRVMSVRESHRSEVATEILDAGALLVGSPTLNNNLFPTVADVLVYLKGLKRKNLVGAAFGSYGWSGEAVKLLDAQLSDMGIEKVAEPVSWQYVPDEGVLEKCYLLGRKVSEELKKRTAS